jgi:hypothetical protein
MLFKNFFFIILIFIFTHNCQTPFEKKKKEFENCKITIESLEINNLRLFIIPLAPKAYIKANLRVENTNDVPVDIEKFYFKTFLLSKKNKTEQEQTLIADVTNQTIQTIPANSVKIIPTEMQTLFEENSGIKNISTYLYLAKTYLNGEDIDLLMDGNIEFSTIVGKLNIPVKEKVKANLNQKKKQEEKKP